MTTDTVKNAKMTTESVVNFVFFETLTTEKSATGIFLVSFIHFIANLMIVQRLRAREEGERTGSRGFVRLQTRAKTKHWGREESSASSG